MVPGEAAIPAPVLLPDRGDHQGGVVLGEAVSVSGDQGDVVPLPAIVDVGPVGYGAGPGDAVPVLHHRGRGSPHHDRPGNGDCGGEEGEMGGRDGGRG